MNSKLFSSLPLSPEMLHNLETMGYLEMTPIQAKSLPYVLKSHDIVAKAKTGSGKTAAFGLGLLANIDDQRRDSQALVMCPTRELADQVSKEIRRLARFIPNLRVMLLCGGKPFRAQAESLLIGAHVIVGTPGRIQDHLDRKTLNLDSLKTLVLDEADRMLDMGFYEKIVEIINHLPKSKQTLLFSATYPSSIAQISQLIQKDPIEITVDDTDDDKSNITQVAYMAKAQDKSEALAAILTHYNAPSAIVFCRTKKQCDEIAVQLVNTGFDALAIHGDLEQRQREEVLLQFANNSASILVATDVAARGLDIKDLPLVINYELPTSPDVYVHRIGRTGRNGKSGLAISIFLDSETFKIELIEKFTKSVMQKIGKAALRVGKKSTIMPTMRTLCIQGGKKNKMRPGDILGALTGDAGLSSEHVGKIDIFDFHSYVAINRNSAEQAMKSLQTGKIKGRTFNIRYLDKI